MCGHVGAAGDLFGNQEKVFKQMLVMDSVRGEDSTGVAFIGKFQNGITIAKEVGDPFVLMYSNRFEKAMGKANRVLIGHNRFATQGAINKRNAHPFEFDSLIGAHNGTLSSKYKLLDNLDFKVDSENLYHHIEQRGVQDAINLLGNAGNSYSLVWWDKEADTLNFLRNKERPMWMTRSKDGKCIFWASEPWMLYGALGRNGIEHESVEPTPEDMHISFPINQKGEIGKPTVRKVAPPPNVVYVAPQNNGKPPAIVTPPQPNKADVKPTNPPVVQNRSAKEEDTPKKPSNNVVELVPNSKGSDAIYLGMKKRKLELLTSNTDKDGQQYFSLFDPDYQCYEVRLYARSTDKQQLMEHLGGDILGDITAYQESRELPGRGYYKVSPWSIAIINEGGKTDDEVLDSLFEEKSEGGDGEIFRTASGHYVSREEWEDQNSSCAWCSMPPKPETARFTGGGDCLCGDCARNEHVLDCVTLV